MGLHRADTRASRGRSPVTHPTPLYPVSQPGKRAARKSEPKPAPAARPATRSARRVAEVSAELSTGVPQPVETARRSAGGRRSASRKSLIPGLPSAPILLGVAALAISAGGAVSAANPQLVGAADQTPPAKIMQASALTGTGGVATTAKPGTRGPVVSRDSRRDAQSDAQSEAQSGAQSDAQSDAGGDDVYAAAEAQVKERNAAMADLAKQTERWAAKLKLNLWKLPVAGYRLTATFGQYGLWSSYHTGLDFAADTGTPIYAVANGTISSASYDGAYGNKTVQTLDDGTEIWYCHQNGFAVGAGETVHAGELIGYVGSTGHVTGPHLHLEVRPGGGDPVDPYSALVVHGITP